MNLGIENRRQAIIAGILVPMALSALIYLGSQFFSSSPTAPPPPTIRQASSTPAENTSRTSTTSQTALDRERQRLMPLAGNSSTSNDPTLHPEVMLAAEHLEYTGSGRNIFSATSAPMVVKIPTPVASARINHAPIMPVRTMPAGPPAIPLKFFGTATGPNGTRRAFLQHDEDVFMAQVGDVVMRQYKVTNITANSIEIEDLPNNNKQVLPLLK